MYMYMYICIYTPMFSPLMKAVTKKCNNEKIKVSSTKTKKKQIMKKTKTKQ